MLNTDSVTTILGIVLAVGTAAQAGITNGLPTSGAGWFQLLMAAAFAGIGYFTNKSGSIKVVTAPDAPKP